MEGVGLMMILVIVLMVSMMVLRRHEREINFYERMLVVKKYMPEESFLGPDLQTYKMYSGPEYYCGTTIMEFTEGQYFNGVNPNYSDSGYYLAPEALIYMQRYASGLGEVESLFNGTSQVEGWWDNYLTGYHVGNKFCNDPTLTGIPELTFKSQQIVVYPNPATTLLNIHQTQSTQSTHHHRPPRQRNL